MTIGIVVMGIEAVFFALAIIGVFVWPWYQKYKIRQVIKQAIHLLQDPSNVFEDSKHLISHELVIPGGQYSIRLVLIATKLTDIRITRENVTVRVTYFYDGNDEPIGTYVVVETIEKSGKTRTAIVSVRVPRKLYVCAKAVVFQYLSDLEISIEKMTAKLKSQKAAY